MSRKDLLIHSVHMVDIDGSTNIPTVLFYEPQGPVFIGSEALAKAKSSHSIFNTDFKLELGKIDPTSQIPKREYRNVDSTSQSSKRKFDTAAGTAESAARLTTDFLHKLLLHTREWLTKNGITESTHILLAEPLAMQAESGLVSSDWLSNYRRNLERILKGEGFENIDFLPEPFAVFQYYRYGIRHPLVAERIKQHALVIDFGGGTFDVCIIETKKDGDISQAGRNSRPLAAASEPVGGFFINRVIAEELFRKLALVNKSNNIKKGIEAYKEWQKGRELSFLSSEYRNFVNNFHNTSCDTVEYLKLTLCKNITNWHPEASLTLSATVPMLEDPLNEGKENLMEHQFQSCSFRGDQQI